MSTGPLRLRELLTRLVEADVRFVLVGGLAVNAWGYLRATRDVDIVPEPEAGNLARLTDLLLSLEGRVEAAGETLAAGTISTFLRAGDRTLVTTALGQLDILQGLPQIPRYSELERDSRKADIEGLSVQICSLEALLEMKRASDRPRDRDDLEALEAAHERDQ
jgi:predicted nucleotidyltransferase